MRRLGSFLIPDALILAAVLALVERQSPSPAFVEAASVYAPPLVLLAGVLLGLRFRRGRVLLAFLILVLTARALGFMPAAPAGEALDGSGRVLFNAIAILLPLNLCALALLPERGLLTPNGVNRLGVVLAQAAVVWMIVHSYPAVTADAFEMTLLPSGLLSWIPGPQLAALATLAALSALIVFGSRRPVTDPLLRGFGWAIVAVMLALRAVPAPATPTIYLATAGLILAVASVESAHAMAFRDELTGLPARRALDDLLNSLDGDYTVAMVDVDHFKQFNDSYGHDVGDQVLRMVAARLEKVGGGGRAFRYGGEEFTVVFPGRSLDESLPEIETLREAIEMTPFALRGKDRPLRKPRRPRKKSGSRRSVAITVSIGVAGSRSAESHPHAVVDAADKALYRAKHAGRNRVCT